jgi:ATP-binding protein involved in chromosome partitioning
MVTRDEVLSSLRGVIDPELGASLVDLGFIRDIEIANDRIQVRMVLTIPGCPLAGYLVSQVQQKVEAIADGRRVEVSLLDDPWHPPGPDGGE